MSAGVRHEGADAELFTARVTELAERSGRGQITVGDFMSPGEICTAERILDRGGYGGRYAFFGGYANAERARLVCLPDYMLYDGAPLYDIAADVCADEVVVLYISGSGYKTLSHRDFMGAILALGIKRHVIGDIIVDEDGCGAHVVCDAKIAAFIAESLSKIGSDTVSVREAALPRDFRAVRKTEPISDTVASMRADCIVPALIRCSREHAKELITAGLVDVNYETWTKPDAALSEGDVISVRGEGKFTIVKVDGMTRRGRLRLIAEKYI